MNDFDAPAPEETAPEIQRIDRASTPHIFRGAQLQPFSPRRQLAAQALGNKLLSGRAVLPEGGAYDGMFADVVSVIYLCTAPASVVLRAVRQPDAVLQEAIDWADKEGLGIGSAAFNEACTIYGEILQEIHEAQFDVAAQSGTDSEKKKESTV